MPTELQTEIANTIQAFVDGTAGKWDWDEFTTLPIRDDPDMEEIRLLCASLPENYPPDKKGHYCNEQGIQLMRDIVLRLRSLPD